MNNSRVNYWCLSVKQLVMATQLARMGGGQEAKRSGTRGTLVGGRPADQQELVDRGCVSQVVGRCVLSALVHT
jgi:hypothetical protein